MYRTCQSQNSPPIFDHGYITSPNYPMKYYLDAQCEWRLAVQQRQTIRVTMYDFELDVKKGGVCNDFLVIKDRHSREYFRDCGSLGKQLIHVESNEAVVYFQTATNSLTQRGFFLYFEGMCTIDLEL